MFSQSKKGNGKMSRTNSAKNRKKVAKPFYKYLLKTFWRLSTSNMLLRKREQNLDSTLLKFMISTQ